MTGQVEVAAVFAVCFIIVDAPVLSGGLRAEAINAATVDAGDVAGAEGMFF